MFRVIVKLVHFAKEKMSSPDWGLMEVETAFFSLPFWFWCGAMLAGGPTFCESVRLDFGVFWSAGLRGDEKTAYFIIYLFIEEGKKKTAAIFNFIYIKWRVNYHAGPITPTFFKMHNSSLSDYLICCESMKSFRVSNVLLDFSLTSLSTKSGKFFSKWHVKYE